MMIRLPNECKELTTENYSIALCNQNNIQSVECQENNKSVGI